MKNNQIPFWLFTFIVWSALVLPVVLQEGMFLDGVVHSSIARNMAMGNGSFWSLHYSQTFKNPFYDQLPLAIGIQSVFYRLFGDHLIVERLYSLCTGIFTGFLMVSTWKYIFRNNHELKAIAWLPVLLWMITPVVFWSYANNTLENTMTVFDLSAVLILIKGIGDHKKMFSFILPAGILILAAFLSKGPVGLFPLAAIWIYFFVFREPSLRKAITCSILLAAIPLLVMALIIRLNKDASYFLDRYFHLQILKSISGDRELAPDRIYIIRRLISELLPMIFLAGAAAFAGRNKKRVAIHLLHKNYFLFFLMLALIASLPIAFSAKQAGYYLLPSLPYFALATAVCCAPQAGRLSHKINVTSKAFRVATASLIIILAGVIGYSLMQVNKTGRDKETLSDVHQLGKIIPAGSTVAICSELFNTWELHAYLMRYFRISLDDKNEHEFLISGKGCGPLPGHYIRLDRQALRYEVYMHKE